MTSKSERSIAPQAHPWRTAWLAHARRWRLGYALALSLLIFVLSSFPIAIPRSPFFNDKVAHVLLYAALGSSYVNVATRGFAVRDLPRLLLAFLAVVAFGISDEFHQSFVPGRSAEVLDVVADGVGGLVAVLAAGLTGRGNGR